MSYLFGNFGLAVDFESFYEDIRVEIGINWLCEAQAIQETITLKMADQGRSDVCVVFTMTLCALELKRTVISLLFQVIRLFTLAEQALKSYLKITCEFSASYLTK